MADKPEDEEVITEAPEEVVEPSTAPSQSTEEPETPEPEDKIEEEPAEEVEEEEKPPSRRETLRVQQLLEKLKKQPQPTPERPAGLDYGTALDADPEVIKQLEADRQAVAQAQYQSGMQQAQTIQFRTRLDIDAPRVESKYSQLNQDSSDFNPVLSNTISRWYLSTVGYDPGDRAKGIPETVQNSEVRYSEFVEGIMELADEIAGEKTTSATRNIAKQAAQTGIRPGGGRTKALDLNKAPEQMTDEELKAKLATFGL